MKDAKYWHNLVAEHNERHRELQSKPDELKLSFYRNNVGSILNAYREGDVSFADACLLLMTSYDEDNHVCSTKTRGTYTIVSADSVDELVEKVNNNLKAGWRLGGDLVKSERRVFINGNLIKFDRYLQPMTHSAVVTNK